MKLRGCVCGVVVVGLLASVAPPVISADAKSKGKGKGKAAMPAPAEMEKMMKMMEQLAAPGPAHKALEVRVGDWETAMKMTMGPGAPPMETKGTAKVTSLFDGRFFVEETDGVVMGKPFKGQGITGFDKYRKQYNMVWMDSMGTSMLTASGKFDKSGKVLTLVGKMDEPSTGEKDKTVRYVYRFVSNDKIVFEMWDKPKMKGVKEFKALEVTYTRK